MARKVEVEPIETVKLAATKGYIVKVKIRSDTARLGVPMVAIEPIYKRGKIVRLYLTMRQTKDHGKVYEIDCPGSAGMMIDEAVASSWLRMSWCAIHKAGCMILPLKPDVKGLSIVPMRSSIQVYQDKAGL